MIKKYTTEKVICDLCENEMSDEGDEYVEICVGNKVFHTCNEESCIGRIISRNLSESTIESFTISLKTVEHRNVI